MFFSFLVSVIGFFLFLSFVHIILRNTEPNTPQPHCAHPFSVTRAVPPLAYKGVAFFCRWVNLVKGQFVQKPLTSPRAPYFVSLECYLFLVVAYTLCLHQERQTSTVILNPIPFYVSFSVLFWLSLFLKRPVIIVSIFCCPRASPGGWRAVLPAAG